MNSHFYLIRTSLKNRIKELFRKPGNLVLYLLVILGLAAALISSLFGPAQAEAQVSVSYLLPVIFVYLLLFYAISIQKDSPRVMQSLR